MSQVERKPEGLDLFLMIANGTVPGKKEYDKGGRWSEKHQIWVDLHFFDVLDSLPAEERRLIETLGDVGLAVGRIYRGQLNDAQKGRMWPPEVFGEGGPGLVIQASENNSSVGDPYSLLTKGLGQKGLTYSQAYALDLGRIRTDLAQALMLEESDSAKKLVGYFQALQRAYSLEFGRESDLPFLREADLAWLAISPKAPLLVLAEPTEPYDDPVRTTLSKDSSILRWVRAVKRENYLGPWRNFFEFKLLMKDESKVKDEEVELIRDTSRGLFGLPTDPEVNVSLEFRRLLMASGNGSHPVRVGKNYPNFNDLRRQVGYKNVIYTNIVEEGTRTIIIPYLTMTFGKGILNGISEEQLIRGNALGVVTHEENHPFRIFADVPLEELKATVDGIVALRGSGSKFSELDRRATLLSIVGTALDTYFEIQQARERRDEITARKHEAYHTANTILFNYLYQHNALLVDEWGTISGIDSARAEAAIGYLAEELERVRSENSGDSIRLFYKDYCNEDVWDRFRDEDQPGFFRREEKYLADQTLENWHNRFGILFKGISRPELGQAVFKGIEFTDSGDWEDSATHFFPEVTYYSPATGFPLVSYRVTADWAEKNGPIKREIVRYQYSDINYLNPITGGRTKAILMVEEVKKADEKWQRGKRSSFIRKVVLFDEDWSPGPGKPRRLSQCLEEVVFTKLPGKYKGKQSWVEQTRGIFVDKETLLYQRNEEGLMVCVFGGEKLVDYHVPDDLGKARLVEF